MLAIILSMLETPEQKRTFEQLYWAHRSMMKGIARSILHDERLAEDTVHDAFINISKIISKFMVLDGNETRALIVVIVKHLALNQLKRRGRESHCTQAVMEGLLEEHPPSPEQWIVTREGVARIAQCIDRLEQPYAAVVRLKWGLGMDNAQIADALGIGQDNVRLRIHRARRKLMVMLSQQQEEEKDDRAGL